MIFCWKRRKRPCLNTYSECKILPHTQFQKLISVATCLKSLQLEESSHVKPNRQIKNSHPNLQTFGNLMDRVDNTDMHPFMQNSQEVNSTLIYSAILNTENFSYSLTPYLMLQLQRCSKVITQNPGLLAQDLSDNFWASLYFPLLLLFGEQLNSEQNC